MAIIKKYAEGQSSNLNPVPKLSEYSTFLVDSDPNSFYFKITEFKNTFTGGKNGFLIAGSEHLKESTEVKIQILDVEGNPVYYEPGNGIPEYYEGTSKLVAVYVYEDTPIGSAKITILGELKTYIDENGTVQQIPDEWKNVYNIKWEKEFQINKLLSNEDKVRFYKRPVVNIDEIVKPIFSNIVRTVTQKGFVDGFAQVPSAGQVLTDYTLPTNYLIQINDGGAWTGSIVGSNIEFTDLGFFSQADDLIDKTNLTVKTPYTINGVVQDFSNERYTASFNYVEGVDNLKTALTGSFAKIRIADLTTFVGDVARVKIFRRSQSDLADYQFIQEIQLESNEVLRDLESITKNEEYYGSFDQFNFKNYWITSSNSITTEFNQTFLYNSVKLNAGNTAQRYFTSKSLDITQDNEYTFDFNLRLQSNISQNNYIKAFLSGSNNGQQIVQNLITITSDNTILQKSNITANFKAEAIQNPKLYFEAVGNGWHIADVSLRASQETSFSPDEITFIQPIPRTLPRETFDFRFQFYDINNNYIPVLVEESKTFDGGNLNVINKELQLIPSSLYFQFDSGSGFGNPVPPTTIFIDVVKSYLTGSVNFTSRSFDFFNNELSQSQYTPGQFPGLLLERELDTVRLTVENFTGSREDIPVQFIEFTGECEGVTDTIVITRVVDGKGGVNYEIRPYRGTVIRNNDPSGSLEVQAIRIDGINEINLRQGLPAGRSLVQMHVLSGSQYLLLSEASSSGFLKAVYPGESGSKELNYNAIFNRDSIDGQRTIYLIPSGSSNYSASILTTLTLTDLLDGIDAGFFAYDNDTFTINPRLSTTFTPPSASATASFYRRGTNINPISASVFVFPSMSINKDYVPEYWMYYYTGSVNSDIRVQATDDLNNIIPSLPLDAYTASPLTQSRTLTITATYIEPYSSESVSVSKVFSIVPEGKPGDETIIYEIAPLVVNLNSNPRGLVTSYSASITDIKLKQGSRYLSFTSSRVPGTFWVAQSSITGSGITPGTVLNSLSPTGFDETNTGSLRVGPASNMTELSASVTYNLEIQPYYTSSVYTGSIIQQYNKTLEGAEPIQIVITPSNVNIKSDEVGYVTDYGAANTTIFVKEGNDFLLYNTSSLPGTWKINSIETRSPNGVWSIRTGSLATGSASSSLTTFNRFDHPYVSGSATYTIQVYPFALGAGHLYTSSIYQRTQTFNKAIAPPNARSVDFKATSYTVNYNRDGVKTTPEGAIDLVATAFNTTGSVYFYFYYVESDGSETFYDGPLAETSPGSKEQFISVDGGDAAGPGENKTWKVKISDGKNPSYFNLVQSDVRAEGQLTIAGVKAGADSYKVAPTNENVTISGDLWSRNLTGTGIKLPTFKGVTQLTNVSTAAYPAYTFPDDYDYLGNVVGKLGYSSASIFYKDNWITQSLARIPTSDPAATVDLIDWRKWAVSQSATIVYKIDFENGRQTQFVTQSFSVAFTPPAPYSVYMQNENSSVVYRVSGELEYGSTSNIIRAYRGDTELTNKPSGFTSPQWDAYDEVGYKEQCRISISAKSSHITLGGGLVPGSYITGTPATAPAIVSWTDPDNNSSATIVYQIECEGRETLYKTQSIAMQYEGATGPGIVMRGEWSNATDYIGSVETTNNRRDAVTYLATTDETHYYAAISGSGPNTYVNPTTSTYYVGVSPPAGFTLIGAQPPTVQDDNDYWEYLGQEEFFVAAKIAIFEESYVKNTINVGTKNGTGAFANIVIAGGRTDPYIAIGQSATVGTTGAGGTTLNPGGSVIGYDRPGIFLGIYEEGVAGTTGRFSIKSTGGDRYVKWDGTDLSLSGKLNAGGMELGTGVNSSAGNGLYLNANNYWYDTGTSFKVGGSSNYLEWDGTTLTLRGSLKQTDSGTPEGSFRGNWAAGVAYYEDDTVFYADGSYICGVAHTSTNDTNVNTGYPPNAINSWSVYAAAGTSGTAGSSGTAGTGGTSGLNGAAGTTGPGVVYRGVFNSGYVYYHTTERRDITKVGSTFYLANNLSLNNSSGSVWGSPPNANWSSFGAQFSSVATDVLLAQDATITRGLVMGTESGNTGFIRSANASSLLGGTGFYLDVNGRMRIGQEVSGSTNKYLYWDGTELDINGTINADAGNIGGFVIEDNKLLASGSLLRFDTQIPQIEFYTNATGSAKVVLNPKPNLTSPSGGTLYISGAQYYGTEGNRTAVTGTTSPTAYVTETYSSSLGISTVYSSEPFTPTAFTEGGNTNFLVYIPATSLTISGTTPTANSSYPPDDPSYQYESYYSQYAQPGSAQAQWYLQMFDSTGTTFISEVSINGASTYRTMAATNNYYQALGSYPGPYYWSYTGYTSTAYYQGDISEGTKSGQINIPSSGIYKFRLVLRVSANAAAVYDYIGGGTTYYSTTATSNHTRDTISPWIYNTVTLGGAFEFSPNLNKTEITNGGIQVLSNKDAYIQMYRIEPSAYGSSETLMRAIGAKSVFSAYGTYPANLDEIGIQVNGEIQSFGNYNKFGDTLFTGTGQYNIVDIGGRYTATLADQSYVSTYSNIRPSYDDRYDLGATSYRWRDIFTNGAVNTTSDRTKKTNITESILGLDFINRLKPVSYTMISGSAIHEPGQDYIPILSEPAITGSNGEILKEAVYTYEKNTVPPKLVGYEMGKRTHYGLIAQDIKDTLDEIGLTTTDFAGYVAGDKENHTELSLRYEEFISPIIKAIQELSQKVVRLENQISGSLGL